MWPFSQGEIEGHHEVFVEQLMTDPHRLVTSQRSRTPRAEYIDHVVSGGFPIPLSRPAGATRGRWYDDYVQLVLERDVVEISRIRQRSQLPRLFARLAGQTAQVLNLASAAAAVNLKPNTAT